MKRLTQLIEKYHDVLAYLFFGVLTTIVNYIVYFPCYNLLKISATVSTILAWVIAVIFAYLTNKPFVFKSHDWSSETVVPELTKFVLTRLGSGLMETAIMGITVDVLLWNGNWMKLITSVLVVVINYVGSKLLVFRKQI